MLTYPWIKLNAVLTAIMWSVIGIAFLAAPAFAQEDGPVNEGTWVVHEQSIVVCPAFVPAGQPDPSVCSYVGDTWGPYPTEARCNARISQLAEAAASIYTMTTGFPHWTGETTQKCVQIEDDLEEANLPGRGSIQCLDHIQMADFLNRLDPDTYSTSDGLITISGVVWEERRNGFCHS